MHIRNKNLYFILVIIGGVGVGFGGVGGVGVGVVVISHLLKIFSSSNLDFLRF